MASVPMKPPAAPKIMRLRQSERIYIQFFLTVLEPLMELGQDLVGVELEKTCLVRPDLVDPDVRITRLGRLRNCPDVTCRVGTADDRLRDLLLSDGAGSLRKMGREPEV